MELTENMVRAIAKQAEAERDRRAKIIHAEAEFQASQTLRQCRQDPGRAFLPPCSCATCKRLTEIGGGAELDRRLSDADRYYKAIP